jgi:hypothetical protein
MVIPLMSISGDNDGTYTTAGPRQLIVGDYYFCDSGNIR